MTPQPPRHRRDRRRMHRAGQVRSPHRHGLVTAGAVVRLVTVRLGCFASRPKNADSAIIQVFALSLYDEKTSDSVVSV